MDRAEILRVMSGEKPREERITQADGEPVDFFAMRAFIIAMGRIDDNHLRAMTHWIADRGFSELIKRKRTEESTAALHDSPKEK